MLTSLLEHTGQYDAAETELLQLLEREELQYSEESAEIGQVLASLGGLYKRQDKYDKAASFYERLLKTDESRSRQASPGR